MRDTQSVLRRLEPPAAGLSCWRADGRPGEGFTKAYMHNGVFKSLDEVVHFYNTRDVEGESWAPPEVDRNVNREIFEGVPLGNFELEAEDEAAIVAFLKTLSDGYRR